jgi:flagellar basal-body rod modification protein FlgD
MSINSTSAVTAAASSPYSSSTSNASNLSTADAKSLGKDAFMQLLITKLENQDPTQPQDDSALLAQLAQFSTLEQMQQMNGTLTKISDFFTQVGATTSATDSGTNGSSATQSTKSV